MIVASSAGTPGVACVIGTISLFVVDAIISVALLPAPGGLPASR